jgi:multisubunit Na+/H+ antiporter MnhG subunit
MSLDLRVPMGLMFTIVGCILSIYGVITRGSTIYERSAGMDINLIWGLVMLVFGVCMLMMGRHADKQPKVPPVEGSDRPLGHGH